jgi:hypothetical protein
MSKGSLKRILLSTQHVLLAPCSHANFALAHVN